MAPTTRKTTRKATTTKHKPKTTQAGEDILDLVIPYIYNFDDRNYVSLVSRKFCEIDGITRKRLTVHAIYSNPSRLSKRFPFIEALTLRGPPYYFSAIEDDYWIEITPWIKHLYLEFRCLKDLCICGLVVNDEDLETLARTRGKDLRSLKIKKCEGVTTGGLRHVSKYCNQLRTLCLGSSLHIEGKDAIWLHQLALNSTVLEMFKFENTPTFPDEDFTLLAKNRCNSPKSFTIGKCYLSKLEDAFRYAVRLEHFGGWIGDEESELVGFEFPQNICSLSTFGLPVTRYPIVLSFLNHIRKLKLLVSRLDDPDQCLLFERCPNLEVLATENVCGDRGLEVIGKFCKKLRKLTYCGTVTHVGLIALAKGCTKLECLKVRIKEISNEVLECVGTHLKNLHDFRIWVVEDKMRDLPIENGVRAMLTGCRKLERLDIALLDGGSTDGGLTDVGLEYVGKYGDNLRSLSLTCVGESDAGLVKLSKGCPRLRKLKLMCCPFSEHAVTSFVFDMPSLRYVWIRDDRLALIRPEFQQTPEHRN